MIDRRREPRCTCTLRVVIWGLDASGLPFTQTALVRNISHSGGLISQVAHPLRCGDLVGLQHGRKRARFRIVWTRDSRNGDKIRVAVQKVEGDDCPWIEELSKQREMPLTSEEPRTMVLEQPTANP